MGVAAEVTPKIWACLHLVETPLLKFLKISPLYTGQLQPSYQIFCTCVYFALALFISNILHFCTCSYLSYQGTTRGYSPRRNILAPSSVLGLSSGGTVLPERVAPPKNRARLICASRHDTLGVKQEGIGGFSPRQSVLASYGELLAPNASENGAPQVLYKNTGVA